jgi:hypothetical protein
LGQAENRCNFVHWSDENPQEVIEGGEEEGKEEGEGEEVGEGGGEEEEQQQEEQEELNIP